MNRNPQTGYMDIDYTIKRKAKKSYKYRLWRRTHEVLSAIEEFAYEPVRNIIDLGTADGRMLNMIHKKYSQTRCVGIEHTQELVDFGRKKFHDLEIIQGDIQSLDFPDDSFDIAIAAAVIEHVPSPDKTMREAKRVLRPGGILVLTSPDPYWEYLATIVGHLKADQHNEVMNLRRLCDLSIQCGLKIINTKKFMLSPFGMPFEFAVEKVVRALHLNFLFANQLIVVQS